MSDMKEATLCTRREFLRGAGSMVAVGGLMPGFLVRAVEAAEVGQAGGRGQSIKGFQDGRILVVVQLGGGNDGLNTLVPFTDDAYYRLRPRLGLKGDKILRLSDHTALNARMTALKELYDEGLAGLIQGVGYPNPNRSHFRSMEIWHTATDSDKYSSTGWVGRYLDSACSGEAEPVAAVAVGGERPQAFGGNKGLGVAFQDPNSFKWTEGQGSATDPNFRMVNESGAVHNETLDFLRKVTANASLSSDRVREVAKSYKGGVEYPREAFGQALQTVAKMIAGNLPTRIYYVSMSGFDTHANQVGQQENLLARFADGMKAFQKDMKAQGNENRVLVMGFSEFGRRVAENGSAGTDHGTAGPMFLFGPGAQPGLLGRAPSLTDLDQGDLRHTTDFRRVYASVLEGWLGQSSQSVLGSGFATLPILRTGPNKISG
jgi:uncharacterized protein (DUF1501 family)